MSWLDELVELHRGRPGTVSLSGVILYTDAHANIKKVLQDADYWRSFDEVSGQRLAVFAIRARAGSTGSPTAQGGAARLGYMVPVWREPRENLPLIQDLGLESTRDLPALVLFTRIDGEIVRALVRLVDTSQDAAYQSLQSALGLAADATARIAPANRKNAPGVFAAAEFAVANARDRAKLQAGTRLFLWLKDLMP